MSSILGFLGLAGLLNLVSTVVFAAVALTIMLRINARITLSRCGPRSRGPS